MLFVRRRHLWRIRQQQNRDIRSTRTQQFRDNKYCREARLPGIERLFREQHIEIPYPTQEFLLKSVDESITKSTLTTGREDDRIDDGLAGEKLPQG